MTTDIIQNDVNILQSYCPDINLEIILNMFWICYERKWTSCKLLMLFIAFWQTAWDYNHFKPNILK